jgi:hypothetical protein
MVMVGMIAGLLRCGKSCRLRWTNYLRPDLKRGLLSESEERMVIDLHAQLGNRFLLLILFFFFFSFNFSHLSSVLAHGFFSNELVLFLVLCLVKYSSALLFASSLQMLESNLQQNNGFPALPLPLPASGKVDSQQFLLYLCKSLAIFFFFSFLIYH